ncbi:MAG: hypothetical protein QM808_00265 [Steroidobacteraceae bacterium]
MQSEDRLYAVLVEMRNWIRAAAYPSVKAQLEAELSDVKHRAAYQMFDGSVTMVQVRVACKMSPNGLLALTNRWVAAGLMEVNAESKRVRLFNLSDFGMIDIETETSTESKGNGSSKKQKR